MSFKWRFIFKQTNFIDGKNVFDTKVNDFWGLPRKVKKEKRKKFYFTPKTNSCASLNWINLRPLTFVRTNKVDYLISTSFDVNDSVYGFTNVIGFWWEVWKLKTQNWELTDERKSPRAKTSLPIPTYIRPNKSAYLDPEEIKLLNWITFDSFSLNEIKNESRIKFKMFGPTSHLASFGPAFDQSKVIFFSIKNIYFLFYTLIMFTYLMSGHFELENFHLFETSIIEMVNIQIHLKITKSKRFI